MIFDRDEVSADTGAADPVAVALRVRLQQMGVATAVVAAGGDATTLREAVRRLDAEPSAAAVVEDTATDVAFARGGGFGLLVGVDHGGQREQLAAAGADVVVDDLSQLDLGAIHTDPWVLAYEGVDPAHEGHREALTALGNGHFATRGAAAASTACTTPAPTSPASTTV